jgi:predicted GNAT superfamily acetyltransferase
MNYHAQPLVAARRVRIRQLESLEDFRACERIQEAVWGNVGVSAELLNVTHKYGGAVVGSIVNGKVVGFIYAFLARRQGKLIHWSHLMAVAPQFRDLGLGLRMKLAHRALALKQGLRSICWTFDPLQSRNAALNIGRLGAQAEDYLPDCYGRFESAIEKGLESDRFVVNWRIGSAAVERRLRGAKVSGSPMARLLKAPLINETRLNPAGFPENRRIRLELRAPTLLVGIPTGTDQMRKKDLGLARRWRIQTRRIFTRYFGLGYRVEDFVRPSPASDGRAFYVLRRRVGAGLALPSSEFRR